VIEPSESPTSPMTGDSPLPIIAIVGRKNSGKTTLLVHLAAELKRRGWRVASVKHGHHQFEIDQPGRDSWRHFNEGGVEAVMMVAAGKMALIARVEAEPEPAALIRRHFGGREYHLVLVEGYKRGPFPRIEVHRRELHPLPLLADSGDAGGPAVALVTDEPHSDLAVPIIALRPDLAHVAALADLIEQRFLRSEADDVS
jgi:molybdopterin-guanine dinucleotide biosynthesis protein MobB